MRRIAKLTGTLIPMLVAVALPDASWSQSLDVLPRGTYIELEGPLSARGRDAVGIEILPEGEYRLRTDGAGLASSRARFEVDGGGVRSVPWSSPTSILLPPGVDHLRHGESRGWYHLLSGAAGASFLFTAYEDIDEAPAGSTEEFDAENVRDLWLGFTAAIWLGAGVESWLLTPSPAVRTGNGGVELTIPRANRWQAALRSTLVPGAGQRYLGRDTRANLFTVFTYASAAAAIALQDRFLEARRDADRIQARIDDAAPIDRAALRAELDDARSDEDTKSLVRWIATGSAAYFYLWNVVDAFWLGARAEQSGGPKIMAAPTADGMALSLSWRFH